MEKSRDAFRTISEVAEWLDVPTHVLRFWESRFSQIKPVKRAGGRRYYRPSDMRVIGGVKTLLHDQGMTIRGVQKLFREQGIKHISSFSPGLDGEDSTETAGEVFEHQPKAIEATTPAPAARVTREATPEPAPSPEPAPEPAAEAPPKPEPVSAPDDDQPELFSGETSEPQETDSPATTADIPATPDVPETDPADDAAAHASNPGIAARLALSRPADLRAHRDLLAGAVKRLKEIRDRAS
jgi:DNA-binding transcriptional MerR regulator